MKRLDETIFDETGLGALTAEKKQRMMAYVYKTLETRVGIRLATEATEVQLREFTELVDKGDEQSVFTWLEQFPELERLATEELAEIKSELTNMAQDVLDARS